MGRRLTRKASSVRIGCVSAEVAQLVEHTAENRGVRSPILRLGTISWIVRDSYPLTCGSGSAVERLLAKEKVAGSNPVFRSQNQPE